MKHLTSAKWLTRVAAVLSLMYMAAHSSGYPWTPGGEGVLASGVLAAMKNVSVDVFGSPRTYWDFYLGFGLIISVLQLALALVLWLLADFIAVAPAGMRAVLGVISAAFFAKTYLSWKYFFLPPLVFSLVIALLLLAAAIRAKARS